MIPGLTIYRIDQARKHARDVGQAQPVPHEPITRSRLDEIKVDHFLDFISRPEFIQDVAYGTRTVKLSHGEKLEIPNVIRTTIASRLIQLYQAYCQETGFTPLQRSTLFSLIQVGIHLPIFYCNTRIYCQYRKKCENSWINVYPRRIMVMKHTLHET